MTDYSATEYWVYPHPQTLDTRNGALVIGNGERLENQPRRYPNWVPRYLRRGTNDSGIFVFNENLSRKIFENIRRLFARQKESSS